MDFYWATPPLEATLPYPHPELVEGRTLGLAAEKMGAFLYILRCADGSYYVGSTRASLEERVAQHNAGMFGGYSAYRRPVTLVFHEEFQQIMDAIAAERQVKYWSRAKKEALIRGDFDALRRLAKGKTNAAR